MQRRTVVFGLVIAAVGAAVGLGFYFHGTFRHGEEPFSPSLERGAVVPVADYQLSGPYTHDNLTVFLIHGPATLPDINYLTLQEALEQKKVVVHETGSVGELAIENLSPGEEVYVQSGDIVKGGRQDRTFPYDFIAPPQSGQIPIASFCVEQGRWSQRGQEESASFSSSPNNMRQVVLAGSSREPQAQRRIWNSVSQTQEKLSANLQTPAQALVSPSSLQLSLENPKLKEAIAPYLRRLDSAPAEHDDVIGVVFVVNGKVRAADVYASPALFRKLWPKLLEGSAVEAFSEREDGKEFTLVSAGAVRAFLAEAEGGKSSTEAVTDRVYVIVQEGERQVLSDTCDRARKNVVIHRSVLAR
jgi:hypothetical protein